MNKNRKKLIWGLSLLIFAGLMMSYIYYQKIFSPNVAKDKAYLYIHSNAVFDDVMQSLKMDSLLIDPASFEWLAQKKAYSENIKAGKYLLKSGMSNNQLINMLRSGNQEAVNLVFNNIRTNEQLAGKIGKQIEADSLILIDFFNNSQLLAKYNISPEDLRILFIPNTYKLWWNTSAEKLMDRIKEEYEKFWTEERDAKAYTAGLSRKEVAIIASIVEEETNKKDERPTVASVYINRLRKNMLLQADPTVKYAVGDFSLKRILNKHLEYDSPYNTYKYQGLPPGPICIPSISSIDAVLANKSTDYLYFCAKEDFSGYHNFAKNINEHLANARRYQKALNQRKIF